MNFNRTKQSVEPVGYQIVELETDNPPPTMRSYEIYSLAYCLAWIKANEPRYKWRLLPIFDGDIDGAKDHAN